MSVEILKMLIKSACTDGSLSEQDRALLTRKANDFGIAKAELDKMIDEELRLSSQNSSQSISGSGFVTATPPAPQGSGFITQPPAGVNPEISQNLSASVSQSGFVNNSNNGFSSGSRFTDVKLMDAQGAMSSVYQGKLFGKWIIIKRIKPEFNSRQDYKDLFYKEFENAYHLDHPNIVRLLDKGEDENGAYYTMEYVDGRSLTQIIKNHEFHDDKSIKRVFSQMLDALTYVHKKQIVHRDLKPDNILVTYRNNSVKILDFGLAAADYFDDNLLKAGTPKYAAPEQMTPGARIDQRADIYALGVILNELVTGTTDLSAVSTVSNSVFKQIITKCTQKEVDNRYFDCEEIAEDLKKEAVMLAPEAPPVAVKPPSAPPVAPPNQVDQPVKADIIPPVKPEIKPEAVPLSVKKNEVKKKFPIVPVVIAALLLIGAGVFFLLRNNDNTTSDENSKSNSSDNSGNDAYDKYKKLADKSFDNQDYEKSLSWCDSALVAKKNDNYILGVKKNINFILEIRSKADAFLNDKNVARAKIFYDSVLTVNAADKKSKGKSAFCDSIIKKSTVVSVIQKRGTDISGKADKLGFVDNNGYVVIDFAFDSAETVNKLGILPVKKDGKYSVIVNSVMKPITGFDYLRCLWLPKGYELMKTSDISNFQQRNATSDKISYSQGKYVITKPDGSTKEF